MNGLKLGVILKLGLKVRLLLEEKIQCYSI